MAELVSLSITQAPNKTRYVVGDRFERYGMVVKAVYSDQTTTTLPFYEISPSRGLRESDTSIRVSFMGFSASQAIDVTAVGDEGYFHSVFLKGAELDGNPCINAGDASVRYRCRPIKVGRDAYEISLTLIHFSRMTDRESDLIQGLPKGWRTNFHRLLVQDGQDESGNPVYKYIDGDGYVHAFRFNPELGCHLDGDGCGLELDAISRIVSDRDGNSMSFDAQGRIVSISEPNGKTIVIEYNENGLRKLYDSRKPGDYIKLSYDGMSLLRWIRVYKNGAERKIYDIIGTAGQITSIRESANGSSRELHMFSVNDRDRVNRVVDRLTGDAYRITYDFNEGLNDYIFSSVRKGHMEDGVFVEKARSATVRLAHYKNGSNSKLITSLCVSFGNGLEAMYGIDSLGRLVSSFESIGSGRELKSLTRVDGNPVGHNGQARIIVNDSVADSFIGTLYVNGGLQSDEFDGVTALRLCGYAKIQAGCGRVRLSFSHLNSTSKRIDLNPHAEETWQYFQIPFDREIGSDGTPLSFDGFAINATDEDGSEILMTIADLRFVEPKDSPSIYFEIGGGVKRLEDLSAVELVASTGSTILFDVDESETTFSVDDLISTMRRKASFDDYPSRVYLNRGEKTASTYGGLTLLFADGTRIDVFNNSQLDNSSIGNGKNWYLSEGDALDQRQYLHYSSDSWWLMHFTTRKAVGSGIDERVFSKTVYDYSGNKIDERQSDGGGFRYEYFEDGGLKKKFAVSDEGSEILLYEESRDDDSVSVTENGVTSTCNYNEDLLVGLSVPGPENRGRISLSYDNYLENISSIVFFDSLCAISENTLSESSSTNVYDMSDGLSSYRFEKTEDGDIARSYIATDGLFSKTFESERNGSFHINAFYNGLPECFRKEIVECRDQYDKLHSIYEDNVIKTILTYEPSQQSRSTDQLVRVLDFFSERQTAFEYYADGSVSKIETNALLIEYGNEPGKESVTFSFGAGDSYTKECNGLSSVFTSDDNGFLNTHIGLDGFGRVSEKVIQSNGHILRESFFYESSYFSRPSGFGFGEFGESFVFYPSSGKLAIKNSYFGRFTISKTFDYDAFGRLISETNSKSNLNRTYVYSGSRMLRFGNCDISYDDKGRISIFGDISFEYDDYGNMLRKTDFYQSTTYSYERGCLLSAVSNKAVFKYDYQGKRTKKSLRNGNVHNYHYEGNTLIGEDITSDDSLASLRRLRYLYDAQGVVGFCMFDSSDSQGGTYYTYIKNPFNEIIGIANGNEIVAVYDYDAWGNHKVLNPDGTENVSPDFVGNINPIRFKAYYYDVETGLYYLGSRYYDPEIGRFITPDSYDCIDALNIGGMDIYSYCNNDPINYADPSGHMPDWGWWLLGGLVVAACLAATIVTAGGFAAGGVAITSAMIGVAYGSSATAISSFAFVGAATVYVGALAYNGINIATAKLRGSTYEDAIDDFWAMGESVFWTTVSAGALGAIGGAVSYNDQLKGLDHSWTKERNDFFKNNKEYSRDEYVLHHPYGRHGANIRYYYPVTVEEHKAIHRELGYGRGQGGFYQYREWINWWKWIVSIF